MIKQTIIELIIAYSSMYGIDPKVALGVVKTESNFNPNAVGLHKEVGLFQVRPELVKEFSRKELFNVHTNIQVGLMMLKHAKEKCIHKGETDFLVCYNAGVFGGSKYKYPHLAPYVKKVNYNMENL